MRPATLWVRAVIRLPESYQLPDYILRLGYRWVPWNEYFDEIVSISGTQQQTSHPVVHTWRDGPLSLPPWSVPTMSPHVWNHLRCLCVCQAPVGHQGLLCFVIGWVRCSLPWLSSHLQESIFSEMYCRLDYSRFQGVYYGIWFPAVNRSK